MAHGTHTTLHLTDEALSDRISAGESWKTEFKESLRGKAKEAIQEVICAFSNDLPRSGQPGVVVIGISDKGESTGETVTDSMLISLSDIRSSGNITPAPVMLVEKLSYQDFHVAIVVVLPSTSPPVRFKGRIHVRIGPRRGIATSQEEAILNERRRWGDQPFDVFAIPSTGIADLNLAAFEYEYLSRAVSAETLAANDRTLAQQLAATKMIDSHEDETATVLGILILGKCPQDLLPGTYVQFLRVNGTSLSDSIIDDEEITGTISDVARRLNEKLRSHNRVAVDILSDIIERRTETYPLEALRQFTSNALMHRAYEATNAPVRVTWFDDRIEIHSPGGPFGYVKTTNFGEPGVADYRNPNLAESMKVLGFVQRFGIGLSIARKLLSDAGHPEPQFHATDNYVLVTVKPARIERGAN